MSCQLKIKNSSKNICKPAAGNFRFNRLEFSGSLGDLGLFIPLVVAVAVAGNLNIGIILICAGAMNIITGCLFRQPIPVQPMKAIAIVVITEGLVENELVAAGIIMGILMVAFSGFANRINGFIPKAIVRGIQLGVGLKLALKGLTWIGVLPWVGWNSVLTAVLVGCFLLIMLGSKRPTLLYVFFFGFLLLYLERGNTLPIPTLAWCDFHFQWPTISAWTGGLLKGALPQLPLTLLNSVIAVCALSADYFPGTNISPRKMALSVGLMNLLCVPLGGIPMCHGSGGLAAQYRFGARTGGSVVMLGALKITAGLLFGGTLLVWLQYYPMAILAPMLVVAGLELARVTKDIFVKPGNFTIAIVMAFFIIYLNTGAGFLIGCGCVLIYRLTCYFYNSFLAPYFPSIDFRYRDSFSRQDQ